jgi:ribosomal-protein-alanine N-acetyltransferase
MSPRPTRTIRTARLLLRPARRTDLADLHAVLSDPRAMRYWSTPEHETLAQTAAWLRSMMRAPVGRSRDYVIERDGRVIGKAGAWRLPEVGFILHPDHWRQGILTEAMQAIIPSLFARYDLPRLTAEADPRNAASLALLERLGFVETHRASRTMQWRDEWCDSVYLALERSHKAAP